MFGKLLISLKKKFLKRRTPPLMTEEEDKKALRRSIPNSIPIKDDLFPKKFKKIFPNKDLTIDQYFFVKGFGKKIDKKNIKKIIEKDSSFINEDVVDLLGMLEEKNRKFTFYNFNKYLDEEYESYKELYYYTKPPKAASDLIVKLSFEYDYLTGQDVFLIFKIMSNVYSNNIKISFCYTCACFAYQHSFIERDKYHFDHDAVSFKRFFRGTNRRNISYNTFIENIKKNVHIEKKIFKNETLIKLPYFTTQDGRIKTGLN